MYDAIVVGARCAGSPTAMLLARRGYRVLLVDKAGFPSDTMSTHYIHLPGVAKLQRWGLLDRVMATGAPPITEVALHFGEDTFSPPRMPLPEHLPQHTLCPRRTVLDKVLVDAAVEAGAELREGFIAKELLWDGATVAGVRGTHQRAAAEERARIVIGADGMHSLVAREAKAPEYNTKPSLTFGYYAYWSDVAQDGAELYFLENGGILAFPTNGGQSCVAVGGAHEDFLDFRTDVDAHYMAVIDSVPSLAERVRKGHRETRFQGTADQPNFFRKPFGPGWALVGDAGYHRDFVTGLGITDAFRDAELLADAIDAGFSGRRPLEDALGEYESTRNEIATPLYEVTCKLASGENVGPDVFMQFGLAMARMLPPPPA